MEYHNYNTPLDRIDEGFVRQILSGEFDPACSCEDVSAVKDNGNTDCGCSRVPSTKTCRYNRRYSRRNGDSGGTCGYRNVRREERDCCEATCEDEKNDIVCGCGDCVGFVSPELHGVPLSMVYAPHQHFEGLYKCDEALERGTIFRCLDFPFKPTPCRTVRSNCENKGCR